MKCGLGRIRHGKSARPALVFARPESQLQTACERLLELKGYQRRTQKNILTARPKKGWFLHVHKARGNPVLLDLLILSNEGRYIEVELKTATARIAKHQKALLDQGGVLVRDVEDLLRVLDAWERDCSKAL